MLQKKSKNFIIAILLIMVIGAIIFLNQKKPSFESFDLQPVDLKSARHLAKNIASKAGCEDFEDQHFQSEIVFSCQIVAGNNISAFNIYVFFDAESKDKKIAKFISKEEWSLFKAGEYYIISESTSFPEGTTTGRIKTEADYSAFPGVLSKPTK